MTEGHSWRETVETRVTSESLCSELTTVISTHIPSFKIIHMVRTRAHGDKGETMYAPQSFPAPGSLPMSQFFASGGKSTGVSTSASVLPMNTQDWSPLGWTGLISLQSKRLSRVFSSNTTVQKHRFFGAQLSLWSNSPIHTWPLEKPQLWLDGPLLAK